MLNKFENIEKKYDVEDINYANMQVWSFLRKSYYFKVVEEETSECLSTHKKSSFAKVIRYIKNSFYGFGSWFGRYDYLIFGASNLRIEINNKYVDKSFDKMIELDTDSRYLYIDTPVPEHIDRSLIPTSNIVSYNLLSLMHNIYTKMMLLFVNENYILEILEDMNKKENLYVGYQKIISRFEISKKFMKLFFRLKKPKGIYINCYYSYQYVLKAAEELGIPTIEVQHGMIGKRHFAYHMSKKLDKAFFPNTLLVLGEYDKRVIESSRFNHFNQIYVVGSYILEQIALKPIPSKLMDIVQKYTYSVSVSTQYTVEGELAEFIKDIASCNSEICFLFSLRHYEKSYYDKYELPDNVYLFKDKYVCYDILKVCDVHFTAYSTCGLEAIFFDKRTIFLDIKGLAKVYIGEIENNNQNIDIISNKKHFLSLIENVFVDDDFHIYSKGYKERIENYIRNRNRNE